MMKGRQRHISVFENCTIKLHDKIGGVTIDQKLLNAFEAFYGDEGVPYYSLIHKGVRFNEHVGVIQIGDTLVEVLPKTDKRFADKDEKTEWRNLLIDMIFAVGIFDVHAPSSSSLTLKPNSILDLYFELFINEVEYLLRSGLIKKYHQTEGNSKALKGNLLFAKHIQQNLTHQERFYTRYTTYDAEHQLHQILYKTICLLNRINANLSLHSRIGNLLLNFPEMPSLKVTDTTFEKLVYGKKTQPYKTAIAIARLLLLHYHPDVAKGTNYVLALMFDMNALWEKFVYASLYKYAKLHKQTSYISIHPQVSKSFWKPASGYRSKIIPDIVINKDKVGCAVLDTKWKNINGNHPSPDDLKQMYIYHHYYGAKRVALVYPGGQSERVFGNYLECLSGKETDNECSLIFLSTSLKVKEWQKKIFDDIIDWLK